MSEVNTPKAIYVGQTKDTGALAFTEDFKKAQQFEWVNTYVPMTEHTTAVDTLRAANSALESKVRELESKRDADYEYAQKCGLEAQEAKAQVVYLTTINAELVRKLEGAVTFDRLVEEWNSVVDIREPEGICKSHESVIFKYLAQYLGFESELLDLKSSLTKNSEGKI